MSRLAEVSGVDTSDYPGFVAAMEARRRHFIAHGATSADHSHEDVRTDALEPGEADRIYRSAVAGTPLRRLTSEIRTPARLGASPAGSTFERLEALASAAMSFLPPDDRRA